MTPTAYKAKALLKPLCLANQEWREVCGQLAMLQALKGDSFADDSGALSARKVELRGEIAKRIQPVFTLLKATKLPPLEHAIIELRYVKGYEWSFVEKKVDRSHRHVKRIHAYALEKLGVMMDKLGIQP